MRLTDFDILSFDCYGTLIDWETGMLAGLAPLMAAARTPVGRDEALAAHARHEAAQQRATPTKRYAALLAIVYKRLAEEWGVAVGWDACVDYGRSIAHWPAFPDSAEALRYLASHYRLAILSNVDNASFEESRRRLGVSFDAVFTAEDIGAYKPDRRNFEYMLGHLATRGFPRERVLHVAESLFHDHAPANAMGLTSVWIHRRHAQGGHGATLPPNEAPSWALRFESLAAFAEAHRRQVDGGA